MPVEQRGRIVIMFQSKEGVPLERKTLDYGKSLPVEMKTGLQGQTGEANGRVDHTKDNSGLSLCMPCDEGDERAV